MLTMNNLLFLVAIVPILLIVNLPLTMQINAQTDCTQQGTQLTDRGNNWKNTWGNATSDPGGNIRTDGRQIVSDITTFLVDCEGSYDKTTLRFLLDSAIVI